MDRRKFLSWAVHGSGAVAVGAITVPSVIHALSPALEEKPPEEEWRPVGKVEDFIPGKVQSIIVQILPEPAYNPLATRSVYVWRKMEGMEPDAFVVYSRSCTDLGCPISWDPGSEWFYCPCHGGIFDKEGNRRAGPPKKPLWRYATRIREQTLEINLRSVPPMV